MKIVLAVDGSSYTKRMLSYIAAHQELVGRDNEFIAVNVTAKLPPHVARYPTHEMLQKYYEDEGEKVLKPVRDFACMQGWKLRERHVVGHPGETLAEIVNGESPDLLVIGSHGHGAFMSAALGSVSARVLASTKAPVLIIR
jgi:nucleotide-binding universal stress UspA family protein